MEKEIIFGIHTIKSILNKNPKYFKYIYVIKNYFSNKKLFNIVQTLRQNNIQIILKNRQYLDFKSNWGAHQGIIAKINFNFEKKEHDLYFIIKKNKNILFLILDGIIDPRNLGACIRNADAAGVNAIIVPKHRSAPLNATAIKVSSGASAHIPFIRVSNLVRTLCFLRSLNIKIIGADHTSNKNLFCSKISEDSIALIVGSEEKGLRNLTKKQCDDLISIPLQGHVSSLNVSVATGIFLFEIFRQRQIYLNNLENI